MGGGGAGRWSENQLRQRWRQKYLTPFSERVVDNDDDDNDIGNDDNDDHGVDDDDADGFDLSWC